MPVAVGASIVPVLLTTTAGSMMSCSQYLAEAETSPGKVKPGCVDIAMLCARPIPDSNIPPHHTGIPLSAVKRFFALSLEYPPTRPSLKLIIRHAPCSTACRASLSEVIVFLSHMGLE